MTVKRFEKGFTLVELLVVIAIVAILAGALLIAINPQAMIQKSRDSKRLQDIETLSKAINLALADGEISLVDAGAGCATCTSASGTQEIANPIHAGIDSWVKFTILPTKTGLVKFIPALPTDPINVAPNIYTFASTTSNFELNAVLEHLDNANKMATDGGEDPDVYEVGTALNIL